MRGHTLAALFTLGCPLPAFLLAGTSGGGKAAASPLLPTLPIRIPAQQFWSCRSLRPISEHAPRSILRWTNFWHPSDPLAYPCAGLLSGAPELVGPTDVVVKLNEREGKEVEPIDYISQHGSKEILSPLAYTLTQLWLHANPHIDADTTQLEELRTAQAQTPCAAWCNQQDRSARGNGLSKARRCSRRRRQRERGASREEARAMLCRRLRHRRQGGLGARGSCGERSQAPPPPPPPKEGGSSHGPYPPVDLGGARVAPSGSSASAEQPAAVGARGGSKAATAAKANARRS